MALVDEGFAVYAVRGEVSSIEVEDLVTHSVVTCNDEDSLTAAKYMKYVEGLRSSVTYF